MEPLQVTLDQLYSYSSAQQNYAARKDRRNRSTYTHTQKKTSYKMLKLPIGGSFLNAQVDLLRQIML